jgi:hypothetical protein
MTKEPHFLLDLRLADLADWWLELRCCCGTIYLPLKMLAGPAAADFPAARYTAAVTGARGCGKRPTNLAMVEDSTDRAPGRPGDPGSWRIELVLPEKRAIQPAFESCFSPSETWLPFGYRAKLGTAFLCADFGITPEVRPDHAA